MSIFKPTFPNSKGYHVTKVLTNKELDNFIEEFCNSTPVEIIQILSVGITYRVVYKIN